MPECVDCGGFTKYEKGRCWDCYTISQFDDLDSWDFEEDDIADWDPDFHLRMIKGKIAETLIQELFLAQGYSVYRYGMEHTVPGIMKDLSQMKTEVASRIRQMPDFVIQDTRTSDVHFIEVKYRGNGSFTFQDLPPDYPYDNALIVLVSKKHIKCLSAMELKEGRQISPDCSNYLGNRRELILDSDKIVEFCRFASKLFVNV
jgi:hypothetical protein